MYDHGGHYGGLRSRRQRFRYAIERMATTVLGGAITTCGAGLFMFLCVQTFFTKMATLLTSTVAFSVLYSLFWFMPLLSLVGPEDDVGILGFPEWLKNFASRTMLGLTKGLWSGAPTHAPKAERTEVSPRAGQDETSGSSSKGTVAASGEKTGGTTALALHGAL